MDGGRAATSLPRICPGLAAVSGQCTEAIEEEILRIQSPVVKARLDSARFIDGNARHVLVGASAVSQRQQN